MHRADKTIQRDADAAARLEVAQSRVADLDRRLTQIDDAVEAATKRGKANGALAVMQDQRKARAALASEREEAARELADIKTERTAIAARGRAAQAEAAPVMYVAQLFGIERDAEIIGTAPVAKPLTWLGLLGLGGRRVELLGSQSSSFQGSFRPSRSKWPGEDP
jgi:hypothetical protein